MARPGYLEELEQTLLHLLSQSDNLNSSSTEDEAVQQLTHVLLHGLEDLVDLRLVTDVNARLVNKGDVTEVLADFKETLGKEMEIAAHNQTARDTGFKYFNLDDLPDYEPLEMTLAILRSAPEDAVALNKVLAMAAEDLFEHQQWDELMTLLQLSLNSSQESISDLSLDIHERFVTIFNGTQVVAPITNMLRHLSRTFLHPGNTDLPVILEKRVGSPSPNPYLLRRVKAVSVLVANLCRYYFTVPDKFVEQLIFSLFIVLGQGRVLISPQSPCSLLSAALQSFPSAMRLQQPLRRWAATSSLPHAVKSGLLSSLKTFTYNNCPSVDNSTASSSSAPLAWLFACEAYLELLQPWASAEVIPAPLLHTAASSKNLTERISFHNELPLTDHLKDSWLVQPSQRSFNHADDHSFTYPEAQSAIYALFSHISSKLNILPLLSISEDIVELALEVAVKILQIAWRILSPSQYVNLTNCLLSTTFVLSNSACGLVSTLSREFIRICKYAPVESEGLSGCLDAWLRAVLVQGACEETLIALLSSQMRLSEASLALVKPAVDAYIESLQVWDGQRNHVSIQLMVALLESAHRNYLLPASVSNALALPLLRTMLASDRTSSLSATLCALISLTMITTLQPETFHHVAFDGPNPYLVQFLASLSCLGRHNQAFDILAVILKIPDLSFPNALHTCKESSLGEWDEALQVVLAATIASMNGRAAALMIHQSKLEAMLSWPKISQPLQDCIIQSLRDISCVGNSMICIDESSSGQSFEFEDLHIDSKISFEGLAELLSRLNQGNRQTFTDSLMEATSYGDDAIHKIRLVHRFAVQNNLSPNRTVNEDNFVTKVLVTMQRINCSSNVHGALWWIALCVVFIDPSIVVRQMEWLQLSHGLTPDSFTLSIEEETLKALNQPSRAAARTIIMSIGYPLRFVCRLILEQWYLEFVSMRRIVLVSVLSLFRGPDPAINLLLRVIDEMSMWLLNREASGNGMHHEEHKFWLAEYISQQNCDS